MTDNIFDDKTTTSTQEKAPTQEQTQETGNVFLAVGDRKFNDQDAVIKKITSADEHIARLEQETQALRQRAAELEEAAKRGATLDQVLEAINSSPTSSGNQETGRDQAGEVKLTDVEKITEQVIARRSKEEQRQGNLRSVHQDMVSHYGDEKTAKEKLLEVSAALNMSADDAKELAMTRPEAFKRLYIGGAPVKDSEVQKEPNVRPSVNATALKAVEGIAQGGYRYYKALMDKDPKNYATYFNAVVEEVRKKGPAYYQT